MVATRSGSGGAAAAPPLSRALVTGGAGFLGRHVVQQLLDSEKYEVTVFDVRPLESPRPHACIVGDLRSAEQVLAAVKGSDVVFHIATAAPTGENALNIKLMQGVNIDGTRHVIDACVAAGVPRLVYTSSSSVVFEGRPLLNADESTPYAAKPMDYYTQTKILGEQMVLEANGAGGGSLATVALRPAAIFGEGDAVFVPTVARNAAAGKLKYILGSGRNVCDFTYAGNVAHAHVLAAAALAPGSALAGQAYFITNKEPLPFWDMIGRVCAGLGYPRPRIHLPYYLILFIAVVFEYLIRPLLTLFIKNLRSDFTVNRILIATTDRSFSCAKAERDFGYKPQVPLEQALVLTLRTFQHLRAGAPPTPPPAAANGAAAKKAE